MNRFLADRPDYLSKSNSDCLKGIFAVCVLIHHLYLGSDLLNGTVFGIALSMLGFFSIGTFFFLSGYGLMCSYQKNEAYLVNFPRKRLLPFYILILFLTAIWSALKLGLGEPIEFALIARSVLFGGTIIGGGWYWQVQLLCYIFFYLAFRFCKTLRTKMIVVVVAIVAVVGLLMGLGYANFWYVSTPLFLFGLAFACYKDAVGAFLSQTNKVLLFAGSALAFCLMLVFYWVIKGPLEGIFMTLAECAFVICVLIVVRSVRIDCSLTRFLGSISLEIYATHGIFLTLFHSKLINIENPYYYIIAVSVSTLIAAPLIRPVIKLIFSLCADKIETPMERK